MTSRLPLFALLAGLVFLSGGLFGQDKKDEPKKDDTPRVKGVLPRNWGKLGLEDKQKQEIYKIQAKYNSEIDKLEAKINELKSNRDKEMKGVLTPEQKKRLEDLQTGKGR
jgi:hypothetical protein